MEEINFQLNQNLMNTTQAEFYALLDSVHNAGEQAIDGMRDDGMRDGYPGGGAFVIADGSSELVKLFKKYGKDNEQTGSNKDYTFNNWLMSKNYTTGFYFSNHNRMRGFQNMDMHAAVANAYVRKFSEHNIITSSCTYID
jgi:hypothetical protein